MTEFNLISCCIIFSCSSVALSIILSLPITEIVFGILYYNSLECNSNINIPIDLWLIVKGSFSILAIILLGFLSSLNIKSELSILSSPCLYFLQLFNFIWLILGSIIFWRDCPNLEPVSVNILLYVSLILGYIGIAGSVLKGSNGSKDSTSNNRSSLDV